MLFNTIDFVIFLIAVVIVYYAIPANKYRKLFLLAASYYFYACWNVAFLGLLVFDTLVAYVAGQAERGEVVLCTVAQFRG